MNRLEQKIKRRECRVIVFPSCSQLTSFVCQIVARTHVVTLTRRLRDAEPHKPVSPSDRQAVGTLSTSRSRAATLHFWSNAPSRISNVSSSFSSSDMAVESDDLDARRRVMSLHVRRRNVGLLGGSQQAPCEYVQARLQAEAQDWRSPAATTLELGRTETFRTSSSNLWTCHELDLCISQKQKLKPKLKLKPFLSVEHFISY